jgi:hypothetical protein
LADAGDDAALPYIEQLRGFDGAEADCILGRLRARQGRLEEAAAALEAAFKRCREDPWASEVVVLEALTLARGIANRRPDLSLPLFEAVRTPFVVRCSNHDRLDAMAELLSHLDLKAHCREALKPLEPYVTWDRNWLTLRRDCYVATHDPGARQAARDLEEFLSREPVTFDAALGTRPLGSAGRGQ